MKAVLTVVPPTQEAVSSLGGVFQGGNNLHILLQTNISQLLRGLSEHPEPVQVDYRTSRQQDVPELITNAASLHTH